MREGFERAVLICKSGFTKGAVKKAENFTKNSAKKVERQSIELYTIHDAQTKDWNEVIEFPVVWVDLLPEVRVRVEVNLVAGDTIPESPLEMSLSNDKGETRVNI